MKNMKRSVALLVAIALLIGCAAGGTMAWLMDKTTAVTNTFTTSDISITLTETTGGVNREFKMVPGAEIAKDPTVTVAANSEACWLFVEVDETFTTVTVGGTPYGFAAFLNYNVDVDTDKWTRGDGTNIPENVYYRQVPASASAQSYDILADNKVTVPDTVTKAMMDAVEDDNYPKLTFTAYAVQQSSFATAKLAWDEASSL